MKIENPAAFRFIIDEDLYLLDKDKTLISELLVTETIAAEPIVVAPIASDPIATETPMTSFKYLGGHKRGFLVLVHYPTEEFIDEAHLIALQNILKRMELGIEDVAIVNMAKHARATFEEVTTYFNPKKLLLMGDDALPKNTPLPALNQPKSINGLITLYSLSFNRMMVSNDHKKAFWEQMKTL